MIVMAHGQMEFKRKLRSAKAARHAMGRTTNGPVEFEMCELARQECERRAAKLEKLNGELSRLNETKSRLTAIVAHDFQVPLTCIIGFVQLLHAGEAGGTPAERKDYLDVILRNARRLSRMAKEVLSLESVERGDFRLSKARVSIKRVLGDACASFEGNERHIRLRSEVGKGVGLLMADEDRLVEALVNILGNAVKFSPEGGEVVDDARPWRREIRIAVTDEGAGIPKKDLRTVFEPFYRSDDGGQEGVPGTGIGLSIAKRIVELHGGRIWAENAKNGGARICLTLPAGNHW